LAAGPSHSGVFAQFTAAGRTLELDGPDGRTLRAAGAGSGLVAATEQPGLNQPAWLITGTDPAGVAAAASSLSAVRLRHHLAIALVGGRALALPLEASH